MKAIGELPKVPHPNVPQYIQPEKVLRLDELCFADTVTLTAIPEPIDDGEKR